MTTAKKKPSVKTTKTPTTTNRAMVRVPTIQFGYIEVEVEGSVEEIVKIHNEFVAAYKASLPEKINYKGKDDEDEGW